MTKPNMTTAWLRERGFNDLVGKIEAGELSVEDAWITAMRHLSTKALSYSPLPTGIIEKFGHECSAPSQEAGTYVSGIRRLLRRIRRLLGLGRSRCHPRVTIH
ncbi:hypothetical protein [Devosia sp.]|uniref:hypothetical protein n=1 Tax=Devosia sp. TaxID=1871048 RepID=UPI002AFFB7F8|nr:hypothetical protein [Devosia sp.]